MILLLLLSLVWGSMAARAETVDRIWQNPDRCDEMQVWDVASWMCLPYPMAGMPMRMLMLHGNVFGTRIWEEGTRARDAWASPNMFMGDLGTSLGNRHYLNLELMLTAEKWTFPERGYPLLMQIGESNDQGVPFLDAQHPHSSPVMGLTLSDTFALQSGEKDYLRFFFAPRGEATDGPVAFMHRPTGLVNPDAPLGHHIGQDVGHITSTVIGATLGLGANRFEASGYNGTEPEPDRVDLPIGTPNSVSLRFIREFSPEWIAMISAARVSKPEPDLPQVLFENRYSASAYWQRPLTGGWMFYNSLIYGMVTHYDTAGFLSSFDEEFLFKNDPFRIWGRLEVLQRTGAELEIPGLGESRNGQWVGAATLGYTHVLKGWESFELDVGGSVTKDFLPGAFIGAYGGNPWSGKVFLQLGGMKMWDL